MNDATQAVCLSKTNPLNQEFVGTEDHAISRPSTNSSRQHRKRSYPRDSALPSPQRQIDGIAPHLHSHDTTVQIVSIRQRVDNATEKRRVAPLMTAHVLAMSPEISALRHAWHF